MSGLLKVTCLYTGGPFNGFEEEKHILQGVSFCMELESDDAPGERHAYEYCSAHPTRAGVVLMVYAGRLGEVGGTQPRIIEAGSEEWEKLKQLQNRKK